MTSYPDLEFPTFLCVVGCNGHRGLVSYQDVRNFGDLHAWIWSEFALSCDMLLQVEIPVRDPQYRAILGIKEDQCKIDPITLYVLDQIAWNTAVICAQMNFDSSIWKFKYLSIECVSHRERSHRPVSFGRQATEARKTTRWSGGTV